MTLKLIDELTETRGNSTASPLQGIANVVTGFFGGMGGCAMIGKCIINIRSGGGRLSGIGRTFPFGFHFICQLLD